ncbi:hypothetical protein SVIOM74S_04313 [Streptomyces violarus]
MADRTPPLSVEELHALVAGGEIDTVVLAFPDMQGRLQGKRFAARFFLDEVLKHGTEGCNYLLAVDTEMNTVDGYAMSMSITFMAKYDQREGNSCHIHLSLTDENGENVMAGDGPDGMSELMRHFLAGQLAALRDFSPYAPNINSYKRFQPGSFAPTAVAWGVDNRTCALRVVGHGRSMRFENRLPGGDVNPHLAVAGLVAAGLYGVEHRLPLPEACTGNAYTAGYDQVPATLREAAELWEASPIAKEAFGEEVVAHYLNMAKVELTAYDSAVTDWKLRRSFERL